MNPKKDLYLHENSLISTGVNYICGVDEVGRGSLAGPVVAAAVVMPKNLIIDGVDDSKKLTSAKREYFYKIISKSALNMGIGIIEEKVIDYLNILKATYLAMQKALSNLTFQPDYILVDALKIPEINIPQKPIIHGDQLSHTIACASIIAKVTRDKIMDNYHQEFSKYGFNKHKGYGTKTHLQAIKDFGICRIHRQTFAPISNLLPLN
ncbi:ribonuclease HII [bacterium]|nr:ribonuclease HII [bacterium]MBU1153474.1 ribonuclease HII [bacterium]